MPGAVRGLAALLEELADGGLGADKVAKVLVDWRAGSSETEAVAADVALLHQEYVERRRRRGRAERGEAALEAAQAATGWCRPVACYGFSSFTPSQRRLLRALSQNAPVLLALPYESGAASSGSAASAGLEASLWTDTAEAVRRLEVQPRAFSSRALARVERLAAGDAVPDQAPGAEPPAEDGPLAGVRFLLSAGRRNEVELAAAEIVELLRMGVAPDDIGVLVRQLGPWQEVMERVFRRAGVPFRLDGELSFCRTGLGYALLAGLRGVALADRSGLLTYLRTPFSGIPPDVVDTLEATLIRDPGLTGEALLAAVEQALPTVVSGFRAALGAAPAEEGGWARPDVAELRALAARLLRTAARGASLTSSGAGGGCAGAGRARADARRVGGPSRRPFRGGGRASLDCVGVGLGAGARAHRGRGSPWSRPRPQRASGAGPSLAGGLPSGSGRRGVPRRAPTPGSPVACGAARAQRRGLGSPAGRSGHRRGTRALRLRPLPSLAAAVPLRAERGG